MKWWALVGFLSVVLFSMQHRGQPPTIVAVAEPRVAATDIRAELVKTALSQLGKPYVYGATSGQSANFDCSSFVQWVYAQHGYRLSRTTFTQLAEGLKDISAEELLPGDLIYQQWPNDQHVLMWIGDIDGDGFGDVVNAGGYRKDVNVISNFFGDEPMRQHTIAFKRVL